MPPKIKLDKLRKIITESLRVQQSGPPTIPYIDVAHALPDAKARQNHVVFGRRGCGKTLLLEHSRREAPTEEKVIYLNCEDFKTHSFPNVLIEVLDAVLAELETQFGGWYGKKRTAKRLIQNIRSRLKAMKASEDECTQEIVETHTTESTGRIRGGLTGKTSLEGAASVGDGEDARAGARARIDTGLTLGGDFARTRGVAVEAAYQRADSKIRDLNMLLPDLKADLRKLFKILKPVNTILLQIDDFYHLSRAIQPYVMDYVHRLCKDLPIYFKVATLKHATVLYSDRHNQPIGAQERHDYQPIYVDFTFQDFVKTEQQIRLIFHEFAKLADMSGDEFEGLFKGDGFRRLVIAGGGVPRDCLSLFLEALNKVHDEESRIGKDDVRLLSFSNFGRKIEELKRDSQRDEQDVLLKGIYVIRKFCLDKGTSVFFIPERVMQEVEIARELIFRLLDYRIIHSVGTAFTHKSVQGGSFQGFMIDIGSYAFMRKLAGKMNEIDLASPQAKEDMRSVPILSEELLHELLHSAPPNIDKDALLVESESV